MTPRKIGFLGHVIALRDPWRFMPGDNLYVRGWSQDYTVEITNRVPPDQLAATLRKPLPEAMASAISARCPIAPHYEVEDHLGGTWLLSQLNLSRHPILERN